MGDGSAVGRYSGDTTMRSASTRQRSFGFQSRTSQLNSLHRAYWPIAPSKMPTWAVGACSCGVRAIEDASGCSLTSRLPCDGCLAQLSAWKLCGDPFCIFLVHVRFVVYFRDNSNGDHQIEEKRSRSSLVIANCLTGLRWGRRIKTGKNSITLLRGKV